MLYFQEVAEAVTEGPVDQVEVAMEL